jgi:hypothetical protein
MARKRWQDLDRRTQRLIMAAGAADAVLRIVALVDLARRPAAEVRGPKPAWASALVAVNAAGAMPIAYFVWGRRR